MKEERYRSRRAIGKPFITIDWDDQEADYLFKLKQEFEDQILDKDHLILESGKTVLTIGFTTSGTHYMNRGKAERWADHYEIPIPEVPDA